jgi:hypothetical protein
LLRLLLTGWAFLILARVALQRERPSESNR